ncbi:MAG: addiction module toxin RelE [Clostridia bacterium]|nr:addiction module toxin RelE [Deltaproteobacteria bacterium]
MSEQPGHTVLETDAFRRAAEGVHTASEVSGVIDLLAATPEAGDEIPGTGGIRKVRVGAKGKGKRGVGRVIYFYYNAMMPIALLTVFAKNDAVDLTHEQKLKLKTVVDALIKAFITRKWAKK